MRLQGPTANSVSLRQRRARLGDRASSIEDRAPDGDGEGSRIEDRAEIEDSCANPESRVLVARSSIFNPRSSRADPRSSTPDPRCSWVRLDFWNNSGSMAK